MYYISLNLHLFYYRYDNNCVGIQIHILRRARTKTRLSLSSLHSPTPSRRDSITWISAYNGSCRLFLAVTLSEIAVNKHRRSELCYRCSWRFSPSSFFKRQKVTHTLTGAAIRCHPVAERTATDVRSLDIMTKSATHLIDAIFQHRTFVDVYTFIVGLHQDSKRRK